MNIYLALISVAQNEKARTSIRLRQTPVITITPSPSHWNSSCSELTAQAHKFRFSLFFFLKERNCHYWGKLELSFASSYVSNHLLSVRHACWPMAFSSPHHSLAITTILFCQITVYLQAGRQAGVCNYL